jgi:DNA polymerase epsilon subunit 3
MYSHSYQYSVDAVFFIFYLRESLVISLPSPAAPAKGDEINIYVILTDTCTPKPYPYITHTQIEHAEQANVDTEPQGGDSSSKVAGEQTPAKKVEKEKEVAFSECELPPSIVLKLLKSALPVGTKVSKEAVGAFSKAAGIFVMYLSNCANDYAHEGKRLTVGASDVISAMEELEFGAFVESMKASVDAQNESKRVRKEKQKEKKKESEEAKGNAGEGTAAVSGGDTAMDVEVDGAAKTVPQVAVEGGEVDMKGDDHGETKEETKVEATTHESEGEGEGEEEEEAEEEDSDNDDEEGEEEEDDDDKPTGLDDD